MRRRDNQPLEWTGPGGTVTRPTRLLHVGTKSNTQPLVIVGMMPLPRRCRVRGAFAARESSHTEGDRHAAFTVLEILPGGRARPAGIRAGAGRGACRTRGD